jgi:hypothetical protein
MAMIGFASAASLTISNVVVNGGQSTIEHNAGSFPISFDITNNGAADPAIAFTLQMTSGTATLTMPTVPIGDGTTTPVTIHVSGTINFAAYQDGSLTGKVVVDDQGGGTPKDVPFSLSIINRPSIKLNSKTALTPTTNGTIEIENNGNKDWSNVQLTSSGDFSINFYDLTTGNQITSAFVAAGQKKTVKIEGVGTSSIGFGGKSTRIIATADDGITTAALNVSVQGSFCSSGAVGGSLKITDVKIDNSGSGDDDTWNLLDDIEIEVTVENNGDDLQDIFVEIGFYDSSGNNQVSDFEFDSSNEDDEEYDLGDIDEDDEADATFKFKVPADFEDGKYKLAVKAYSDDVGEDVQCIDTATDLKESDRYNSIDVKRESDEGNFIAFDDIELTPTEATCGDRVSMTLDVYNIGDEDQDQVKVTLKNTELGIDEFVEIRSGLDQGDKETISFDVAIPQSARDKVYTLALSAEYDYNRGTYRQELDEDTSVSMRVIGCGTSDNQTGGGEKIAIIGATLESEEVVAGGEVVVKATITNLKSQRTAFAIDALDYQSWATLDEISPRVVDIPAGESKDVLLTFTVDEAIEGEHSFNIEAKDGLGGSELREIALNVESTSSTGTGLFNNLGNNAFLWVIGAVNVILVVLIIVVAVRVARR